MCKPGFICAWVVVLTWVAPKVSTAGMSEQELRLTALEEKQSSNVAPSDATKRFTFGGDFRVRYQDDDFENARKDDVYRIRMRLKGKLSVSENLDVVFRLATGKTSDSTSTNQTLGEPFHSKIDQAYVRWTPAYGTMNFVVQGGKAPNPFHKSKLVWDSDVNLEGLSETITYEAGETTLQGVFGQYTVDEQEAPDNGVELLAFQGTLIQKTRRGEFKISGAYYNYVGVEGGGSGNTSGVEIKLVDVIGEWSKNIYGRKLRIFAEHVENIGDFPAAVPELNNGWQIGGEYGNSGKKFGDWDLKLIYRVSQRDAVFARLDDSDFSGGGETPGDGSGRKGWEVGGGVGVTEGAKFAVTYFDTNSERGPSNARKRFQADMVFKF